ncbi:MAG: chromosomal replication initiator protein DnaA [Heliobacteriaceae bacterium]|jgi:chromosomal replication initiator protein|nr:chromosomal replication initiator protein DnaA [Heliobacteriaceae bacterium]
MDVMEVKEIWGKVKGELRESIPAHAYYSWVDALEAAGYDNDNFSLLTVHMMAPQIVRQSYYSQISSAFKKVTGKDVEFSVSYDADLAEKYKKEKKKESSKSGASAQSMPIDNLAQMQSFSNLNLKYKFENFVVGENSRFAHAAARAVSQNPAKKYNPLFIYGASGLGKTHLMQAIGHYVVFNKPKLKVKYIKTEEYVNELIKNLQHGGERNSRMEKFRQKYRNVDILLIDDIQFLESKTYTMEEIFHTFDSLHNNNKQIVLTSDRMPKDIPTLPDRLRTRFEMGLVVDITQPDFETRVAILKNLADQSLIKTDFAVFEYIANNFVNNVRELEGAFNKASAYADVEKTDLTVDFARKVLNCEAVKKMITIDKVAKTAGEYYGVSLADFKSASRSQRVSGARHVAVYLARDLTGKSFESIAEYFNKKHTTMLYSYEKIKEDMKTNKELDRALAEIKKCMTT